MIGEFFIIKLQFKKRIKNIFTGSNEKILDIGSGKSPYYHKFIKGKIVCFDIEKSDKVNVVGNADFLPFGKGSFDKIIMVNSLYYFKNPFKVMESASRILKKGGKLVIINPFFYPIHDAPVDKYRFTEFGLKALLEEHFNVEKIEPIGGIFNLPAVMLHSLIKGIPLIAPKSLKNLARIIAYLIFYLPYILSQFISVLDIMDKTKRFPAYYVVVAAKK